MNNSPYFVHRKDSRDIAPFSGYLMELGLLKFSGTEENFPNMHYDDGIEICYLVKGVKNVQVDDKRYQLYPGDGFITCPWQMHGNPHGDHGRGVVCWTIIHPELLTRAGMMKLGPWSRLMDSTQNYIGRLLASNGSAVIHGASSLLPFYRILNEELVSHKTGYVERISLVLDSLLLEVTRLLEAPQTGDMRDGKWGKDLHQKMEEWALMQKVTMDKMAYSFDMSQSTFERKVRMWTGLSPSEYLSKLKVENAKKMLKCSDLSIKEISIKCGFSSSQYFAVSFSKWLGLSPTEFREKERTGGRKGFEVSGGKNIPHNNHVRCDYV